MKTLHVHIGTPKTGTTSIQNFCVDNEKLLEKQGYCYPLFPYSYKSVAKVRNGHFLFGMITDENGTRDKEKEAANYKGGMQKLHELFRTYDNIILSDEDIWRHMDQTKKTLMAELKEEADKSGFALHIIVYLRRQDKFMSSLWNQQIKQGTLTQYTFDEYYAQVNREVRLDYYGKLEHLSSIVGKENITVRRFESNRFEGGNIYADFLSAIGLTLTGEYNIKQDILNTGLYGNTHEIKRLLNVFPEMKERSVRVFFIESLRKCAPSSEKNYPCDMYSQEEIAQMLDYYGDDNRKVAKEYLHEPGAELFDNTIKDLPKWEKDNPYLLDDIVRFVGASSISLFQENQELKKEITELKKFAEHARHPFRTLLRRIKRIFVH